jgi:hypothetical protein
MSTGCLRYTSRRGRSLGVLPHIARKLDDIAVGSRAGRVPGVTGSVLTSSIDVRDVNLAFQLGANSFMIKPMDFVRFVEFSEPLPGHWLWLEKDSTAPAHAGYMPISDRELVARVSA